VENKKIYGYVYLITNKINNKQYVGQTIQTIKARFNNHCGGKKQVISKAIKKHDRKNFIIQELAIAYNQEELTFLEGIYISWFNTLAPNGYNITDIINGKGKLSNNTIQKMKIASNKPERLKLSSQNGKKHRGRKYKQNSTSKYVGVIENKKSFISRIGFNKKQINLGYYNNEQDAAKAYDIAAIKYFGSDAILNFPELKERYIKNKIIVNKKTLKSKIKGIWFCNTKNRWQVIYYDVILNKKRCKNFKTLQDAIEFKYSQLNV